MVKTRRPSTSLSTSISTAPLTLTSESSSVSSSGSLSGSPSDSLSKKLGSSLTQESTTVEVVVRLRPINEREKKYGNIPIVTASSRDKTVTILRDFGRMHLQARSVYSFDNVFSAFTSQENVFDVALRPILTDVMQGFESTVFAYGQTGTGKTHTMIGDLSSPDLYGVIPRSAESIFATLSQPEYILYTVKCSYLEIYNEELCDLFADEEQREFTKVEIMQGKDGIFCRDLIKEEVHSAEDVVSLISNAQELRKIEETKMNKHSSRSHCIFTFQIDAKRVILDGGTLEVCGKLHLVDLAGSESAKGVSSGDTEAKRDRERSNINRSLLTLSRVIIILKEVSEGKRAGNLRIPYRDSKLTRLLQNSLGGKCKTLVIVTLSPSIASVDESVSTLNYAQSANGIVNKPMAISYLSTKPSAAALNTILSCEGFPNGQNIDHGYDGEAVVHACDDEIIDNEYDGQIIDHGYEMECRLHHIQTQVEEVHTDLAENHISHRQVPDRAEEARHYSADMVQKYNDAIEQIRVLKNEILEGQKHINDIAQVVNQTEMQNHITYQHLVDRAEKAERHSANMEQKYDDAKKQIQNLEEIIMEEEKQISSIAIAIQQTEMQNQTAHQQVVDRAEKAEQYSVDMEKKYNDAITQIIALDRKVAKEKKKGNEIKTEEVKFDVGK